MVQTEVYIMYVFSHNVGTTNRLAKLYKEFHGVNLESSCYETPEFKSLARRLKSAIKADLPDGCELVGWDKMHFEVSGFIRRNDGKLYYFSIGDVRWALCGREWADDILFRTAESTHNYHGGHNQFCTLAELVSCVCAA